MGSTAGSPIALNQQNRLVYWDFGSATYGREPVGRAATSLPRCARTRFPTDARTGFATGTRTDTASVDRAGRNQVAPSQPVRSERTQLGHVQPAHKCFDHTEDIILWNQFVQLRWKQCVLTALFAFDVGHEAMPSLAAIFAPLLSIPQCVS